MQSESADPRAILGYEVRMRYEMSKPIRLLSDDARWVLNALTESRLLHTREIVDVLLSRGSHRDDIHLPHVLGDAELSPELEQSVAELRVTYGNDGEESTPCWTINKMLAHPTSLRRTEYKYEEILEKLDPLVSKILKLLGIPYAELFAYEGP